MGKANIERTIMNCLACRRLSPANMMNFIGSQQVSRLCESVVGTKGETTKSKKDTQIKIGKKIYVIKTVANAPDRRLKEDDQPLKSKMDTSSETSNISVKDDSCRDKELDFILRQPIYQTIKNKPFLAEKPSNLELVDIPPSEFPARVATVNNVMSKTKTLASTQNILRWKEYHLRKLGAGGFTEHQRDLKQNGVDFENLIEEYLKTGDDTLSIVSPLIEAYWESLKPILQNIKNANFHQCKVIHPILKYIGTIDCVGTYKSQPMLIEIIKAQVKKPLFQGFDDPLKIVAYAGALNFDPRYSFQVKNLMLVYAYANGTPADVQIISAHHVEMFWRIWLNKLQQFWALLYTDKELHENFKVLKFPVINGRAFVDRKRIIIPSVEEEGKSIQNIINSSESHIYDQTLTKTSSMNTGETNMKKTLELEPEIKVDYKVENRRNLSKNLDCVNDFEESVANEGILGHKAKTLELEPKTKVDHKVENRRNLSKHPDCVNGIEESVANEGILGHKAKTLELEPETKEDHKVENKNNLSKHPDCVNGIEESAANEGNLVHEVDIVNNTEPKSQVKNIAETRSEGQSSKNMKNDQKINPKPKEEEGILRFLKNLWKS